MIDGIITPALRDIDYLAPCAPYPAIPSGLTVHQKPIYRYSIPTEEQPTISILDYITDYNGNYIKPGIYTLALSNDREFLYIIESRELLAVIPVFKLAENKQEVRKLQNNKKELTKEDKRELAAKKRKERFQAIIDKKYAKTGATPPQEYIHMNAEIEYIKDGSYYLVMYERGFLRAWGAIKIKQ